MSENAFLRELLEKMNLDYWPCEMCGNAIYPDTPHIAVARDTLLCESCFCIWAEDLDEDHPIWDWAIAEFDFPVEHYQGCNCNIRAIHLSNGTTVEWVTEDCEGM
jgi:hypothetical protein